MPIKSHSTVNPFVFIALLSVFYGCARLDPEIIQAGGSDYNIAMQQTRDEQMLLNLVRLKYRDTPLFLEIASVSSQFRLVTGASLNASFREQQLPESVGIGGNIGFTEQPTVTYLPLTGDEIAQRMLSPVSIDNILLLINSGWSIARVFRLTVQQMNQYPNAPTASGPTPEIAPEFREFNEVSELLRKMQSKSLIKVGYATRDEKHTPVLVIEENAKDDPDVRAFRRSLDLDESITTYPIHIGNNTQNDNSRIFLSTRSLMGVMYFLSHSVNVPTTDESAGIVTSSLDVNGNRFNWEALTEGIFSIKYADSEPAFAAATTYYRGNWFYLDDRDLDSKSTFSLLAQLFSLQAGKAEGTAPILTLPVSQ